MGGLKELYKKSKRPREFFEKYMRYLNNMYSRIDYQAVEDIINAILRTSRREGTIYFIGNGGSASIVSHLARDINFGTRRKGLKPIKTVSLVDNITNLTSLGNDQGYENIFLEQIKTVIEPKDMLFALSCSGNSENIIRAVHYAKRRGAYVIGCTGFEDGGKLRKLAHIKFHVKTQKREYGPVEDIFMILDHMIFSYLCLCRKGTL